MGLETGEFIPDLVDTNPGGSDPTSEGDDHLRLIKLCVQNSFQNFVGTQLVPAFVSLTEVEINDAALQGRINTMSAENTFNAPLIFGNLIPLQCKGSGGAPSDYVKMSAVDRFTVGGAGNHMDHFAASGSNAFTWWAGGVEVARHGDVAAGGVLVSDLAGFFKKAGFRNPSAINLGSNFTIRQEDEDRILFVITFNLTVTAPQLEIGTTCRIITTSAATTNINVIEGAGVTIIWDAGGSQRTGQFGILPSSVVELYWRSATEVHVFGNGII